jgi:hypothetical protein
MPQFTPWNVPSPFPNVLYNPAAVDQAANQTIEGRQKIGATDMEMVGRAAGSLLGMSEADAAAAYPGMIADLQRQGFARYAPPDYPGHAAVQGLVQRGLTVPQQYETGLLTAPGVTDALKAASAPLTSGNTAGGGTAASGGGGGSFLSALADIESGDKNIVSGVDKDSKGLTLAQGGNPSEISQGHFQIQTATWRDFAKQAGVDVNQYPTAMSAPREVQAQVASVIPLSRFGPRTQTLLRSRFGPLDTNQTVGALAGTPALTFAPNAAGPRVATAPPPPFNPNAGPRVAGAPAAAPPQLGFDPLNPMQGAPTVAGQADVPAPVPPSPVASRTGGTDLAGPGGGPVTMGPVERPNTLYQTGLPGVSIRGPGNALAPPPATAAAPPAPVTPQPAPVAQAPAAVPAPPATRPATGQNSPQFQAALELNRRAQALDLVVDPTGRTKALAASLRAQAALYMQADSVSYDPKTGIGTKAITGEQVSAPTPAEHWVQNPDGTLTNTSTGKKEFPPTGRQFTDAQGNNWIVLPGGGVKQVTSNPSGVTGSGDDASALRIMNEVAPKIANGTATQQEQLNYASAADVYSKPIIQKDENTGRLIRVPTRDLPSGFPPSPFGGTPGGAQPLTEGMTPAQKSAETKLGEDFATTDKKSYDAANISLGMLTSANNAAEIMNRTPGGWTATGPGANTRMELASRVNQISGLFGGKPAVDPAAIGEWEALNKQTKLMGMQVVNNYFGGSREAASIINGATTAVPNSENSYLGFRMVSSAIEQDLQRQRELYQFKAQQLAAGKPLATAEVEFNKQNPVQSYTQRAIANAVPDDIVAHLTANPDTVAAFDKHFGKGIGEFILKGGRTGMGASAGAQSGG